MIDNPDHDSNFRFTLGTLFAMFTIVAILLAIPVFGVLLLSTILGVFVFLGLVIAFQFLIFIMVRCRSDRCNRLWNNNENNKLETDTEEFRLPTSHPR